MQLLRRIHGYSTMIRRFFLFTGQLPCANTDFSIITRLGLRCIQSIVESTNLSISLGPNPVGITLRCSEPCSCKYCRIPVFSKYEYSRTRQEGFTLKISSEIHEDSQTLSNIKLSLPALIWITTNQSNIRINKRFPKSERHLPCLLCSNHESIPYYHHDKGSTHYTNSLDLGKLNGRRYLPSCA